MIVQPDNAVADPQQIVTDLQRRLDESVAQQTATAEVMQLINASPFDLAHVFDAITDKAMHLCDAGFGGLWVVEGDLARAAAWRNLPEAYTEFLTRRPMPQAEAFGPNMKDRPVVHIADLSATESYRRRAPLTVASVELGGIRTYLAVPLREGGALAGVISLYRKEVRAFTDRQIALVQGFAAQAEIAMKNARLFEEVQAKTRELTEALTYQTGSSKILSVIASSPTDVGPVLNAVVESACELCEAYDASRVNPSCCLQARARRATTGRAAAELWGLCARPPAIEIGRGGLGLAHSRLGSVEFRVMIYRNQPPR
jgi:two-component system, NtrC family, sensor kinase